VINQLNQPSFISYFMMIHGYFHGVSCGIHPAQLFQSGMVFFSASQSPFLKQIDTLILFLKKI